MSDPRELLLAPTDQHVEAALAEARGDAPVIARTLRSFVRDALARIAPNVRLAEPAASRMATREVLDARSSRSRNAISAADSDEPATRVAFAEAVDRAVGRLRRSGASPALLRETGAPRAHLLADVIEGVDALLAEASLVDERRAGTELAIALRRADPDDLAIPKGRVLVTGHLAWEGGDLEWLEALHGSIAVPRGAIACAGAGVTVALPQFGGDADPSSPIADALERRWASLSEAPEIAWTAASVKRAEIVVDAKDDDGEARAVSALVLDAIASGTSPERIAILVPDLDEAALEPLRAALDDARVAWTEPRGRPATSSPEARAALGLLAIAAGPVLRDTVIEVLRAPGLHAGTWTELANEGDAARRATELAHRLRDVPVAVDRTGTLFVEALSMAVAKRRHDDWMPRALDRLLSSAAHLNEATTIDESVTRVLELFDRLRLGQPSADELGAALQSETRGGGSLALRAMGDGTAALRAIREAAISIRDGARSIGRKDAPSRIAELAVAIERAAASAVTARGGARRAGAVRIARPSDVAALEHDLVIVTRTIAGAYVGDEAGDAILSDRIAAQLPAPVRPPGTRDRAAVRAAELAWALAGAASLAITRSARGEDDLGPPHPLVKDALDGGARRRVEPTSRLAAGSSRPSKRSIELAALSAGAKPAREIEVRARIERARAAFFLDPRAAAGAFTGRAEPHEPHGREHLVACVGGASADRTIAVTSIERAAGCAFAGFASRVLRVRRTEDVGEAADPRERGTLVHRGLRAAYESMTSVSVRDRERLLVVARAAAERAVDQNAVGSPLRREARMLAASDAMRVVARDLAETEPFSFVAAERRFGAAELPPWQALELAADPDEPDRASVFVDGQVDRVDATTDRRRARVVDYKTGGIPDAASRERTAFQLPLYAELAARALGATEVEAIYLRVPQSGGVEIWPKDPGDRVLSSSDRAAKAKAARRVVLALWTGEISPRPYDASLCARCDARDICRRPDVAPIDDDAAEPT